MSLNSNEITAKNFKTFYDAILPYLNGNIMFSTNNSDYYSTDEKMIGVWTNGKPIYQKVFTGTTPAVTSTTYADTYVSLGISIDEVVDSRMILQFTSGVHQIIDCSAAQSTISYATSSTIDAGIKYIIHTNSTTENQNSIHILNKGGYSEVSYVVILQYTKTTDSASSATTIAGAYDINFPNTWVENTEIYFGNGLYGYRATGNLTATSAGSATYITMIGNGVAKDYLIYSYGGNFSCLNVSSVPSRRTIGVNYGSNTALLSASDILIGAAGDMYFIMYFGQDYCTASDTYDIWVTYTK